MKPSLKPRVEHLKEKAILNVWCQAFEPESGLDWALHQSDCFFKCHIKDRILMLRLVLVCLVAVKELHRNLLCVLGLGAMTFAQPTQLDFIYWLILKIFN